MATIEFTIEVKEVKIMAQARPRRQVDQNLDQ